MQPQSKATASAYRSLIEENGDRLPVLRQQMDFINTIGKRFVAAIDRFQVHRALLATLKDLYHFSACSILLEGDPIELTFELSIIPSHPLSEAFIWAMMERIARAAEVIDFPSVTADELALMAYLDAPDDLAQSDVVTPGEATDIGDFLTIPLTVENRIIGMLSLFDEREGAFDAELLQLTTMIADYAAVALENVRLRERERALWRDAEVERQRLELVINSMAEGLLITNAEGAITSLNNSAQHLLSQARLPLEETTTPLRRLALFNEAKWLSDLADIIDRALAGNIIRGHELLADTSDEAVPLTLSISAAPLYDSNQSFQTRILGVVAVLNDITSHKQIEKLKDEFVSIVSHELRTPLTTIKGYTQHLIRRIERRLRGISVTQPANVIAELPESYDLRSLNIVQSQTDHLERLVNDLLDLSRVQWGELHLQYSSFYLADVLAESVRQAQISAEQHTIYLDIDTQDSKLVADKLRISQVVGNILDNAIKFSPQGKQVTVTLKEQDADNEYLVSISDRGIGVSPDYFDHIFERFYRVRNTASRQYSGIGMGLYIAKAILEAHGGRIWLSSHQGTGSTFYFTLPRVPHTSALPAL
ncbi:MAG TPA: ATP-binding protein [Ktedonobacteraceae bacterium]|nr:ATP-binding protein [Ktedonobacteraceae bacterium]